MERTDTGIKVWYWLRNDLHVSSDIKDGAPTTNTNGWGQPFAYFLDAGRDIVKHFGAHNVVIDLTFCGDWAGAILSSSSCPGDCATYVNENPSGLRNAYFDIAWLF